MTFAGYTSAAGDGGMAIFDGGTSGASYVLLTASGSDQVYSYLTFQNNGATGSASGVTFSGTRLMVSNVVVNSVRGWGFDTGSGTTSLVECEAYACNQSNTAGKGGITIASGSLTRCISHDNAGSNSEGFRLQSNNAAYTCVGCIADTNGLHGWVLQSVAEFTLIGCDAYNNGGDGIRLSATSANSTFLEIESCNFVKNTGWAINDTAAGAFKLGFIRNCGFGSGTQANGSGNINGAGQVVVSGSVTYAANVTPWKDPANGDFSLNLPAALNTGRGTFTETAASYAGTVGYPPIGAAPPRIFRPLLGPGMTGGPRG